MRILFGIHLFPPQHRCGAEMMAVHLIHHLQSKGHEVRVIHHCAKMYNIHVPYVYDGIPVYGNIGTMDQYAWADVLVTHLDYTHHMLMIGSIIKRPVVCLVHNNQKYNCIEAAQKAFVVYNAESIARSLNYSHPSITIPPPCDWRKYDVGGSPEGNKYITLINLNHNKGGEILYRLAERMPERKFLGVMGSYDPQMVRRDLPNVTIIEKQQDMREVYGKTRILIMPSLYESWGMTATEAMASGIPVIACETEGLKENLSYAGLFMPMREWASKAPKYVEAPYDIEPWVHGIEYLDDSEVYSEFSALGRKRSRELDPIFKLEEFESFIIKAKQSGYNIQHKRLQPVGRII